MSALLKMLSMRQITEW